MDGWLARVGAGRYIGAAGGSGGGGRRRRRGRASAGAVAASAAAARAGAGDGPPSGLGPAEFLSEADLEAVASRGAAGGGEDVGGDPRPPRPPCPGTPMRARHQDLRAARHAPDRPARHGVLIYVAVPDHKLAVIGDAGIHERVGEAYWRSARRRGAGPLPATAPARRAHRRHRRAGRIRSAATSRAGPTTATSCPTR